jgi:hypothetical protein
VGAISFLLETSGKVLASRFVVLIAINVLHQKNLRNLEKSSPDSGFSCFCHQFSSFCGDEILKMLVLTIFGVLLDCSETFLSFAVSPIVLADNPAITLSSF